MRRNKRDNCVIKQWWIRGRGLGAGPPLILDQTEKMFLEIAPAYLRPCLHGVGDSGLVG